MKTLLGKTVYFDTNLFIYYMELFPEWERQTSALFDAAHAGDLTAVTSELSLAECLVDPIRRASAQMVADYTAFVASRPTLRVVPVSRTILLTSAEIRARTRAALPDAIHCATADQAGCEVLLTNDRGFPIPKKAKVLHLLDIAV